MEEKKKNDDDDNPTVKFRIGNSAPHQLSN